MWDDAQLIPCGADWAKALDVLETGRDFDAGQRHSVYNIQRLYLDFLTRSTCGRITLPGDATRRRTRLLPARQVQPSDLRLRADLLHHRAEVRSTTAFAEVAPAPSALATTPTPTPTSGTRRRTP